jgi:hypothetical protein
LEVTDSAGEAAAGRRAAESARRRTASTVSEDDEDEQVGLKGLADIARHIIQSSYAFERSFL